jgi:hypothetical protein
MNQIRSTCIAMTLLLVAVSLAYGGYSVIRGSQTGTVVAPIPSRPAGSLRSVVSTSDEPSELESAPPSPVSALGRTEMRALDAQLKAIEDELQSLEAPADPGDAAIESGLN